MASSDNIQLSLEQRARLLGEVRALSGATLQKLWLPSAQVCVLQLRVPGRTLLAVVDARLSLAAVAAERPTAPDSAPRSQATLRAALTGARLDGARLQIAADAPSRRAPAVRLDFTTEQGHRALIAEEDGALVLVALGGPHEGEAARAALDAAETAGAALDAAETGAAPDARPARILWASSGAGPARRPGALYPPATEVPLPEAPALPDSAALVRSALATEEERGFAARRREVAARLKSRVQKLRRTLAAVEEDAARAARAGEDRARAELLLPHQGRIPRGAREARVPDWSRVDEEGRAPEVTLELDPAFSAAENAARWLRRAKRYLAAAGRIAARRAEVGLVVARAEELQRRAAEAADAAQLALVESEAGPAPQRGERGPGAQQRDSAAAPRKPYRTFRSAGGAPILVGRGARENDELTLRVARGNDVWLHARGVQGAHVLLPGAGDSPDPAALGDAALLAAHFSSARGTDAAEVAWTRRKHVRKAKGSPPGAVTYSQEKTLRVRLDEARLSALLASEAQ